MPNVLTGDYEAVVQIATRQVDGLLGTLHQNAAIPDATPTLLTSVTVRIGDSPRRTQQRCAPIRRLDQSGPIVTCGAGLLRLDWL